MLPRYDDILSRVDAAPRWWNGSGVPRFEPFVPDMLGPYASIAVEARIACQGCGTEFVVAEGWSRMDFTWVPAEDRPVADAEGAIRMLMRRPVIEDIAARYRFGDPPRHANRRYEDCLSASMSTVSLALLSVWERPTGSSVWVRRVDLEALDVRPDWFDEWESSFPESARTWRLPVSEKEDRG
jgi:hypothetical protein